MCQAVIWCWWLCTWRSWLVVLANHWSRQPAHTPHAEALLGIQIVEEVRHRSDVRLNPTVVCQDLAKPVLPWEQSYLSPTTQIL